MLQQTFPKVGTNESQVYLSATLFNGCEIYVPLFAEGQRDAMKEQLDSFTRIQEFNCRPEPELA